MDILTLILLGIGLSFDTFAVSVTCGLIDEKMQFKQAARIAVFFTFFQALMPIIGWLLGYIIKDYIIQFDHWIAFGLLSILGIKMIRESFSNNEDTTFNPHAIKVILTLSVATTIDALIIGVSFAFLSLTTFNIANASLIIGTVTFIAAMLGMLFGKKLGAKLGRKMEIIGGLILIGIGVKILIEHIF